MKPFDQQIKKGNLLFFKNLLISSNCVLNESSYGINISLNGAIYTYL